LQYYDERIDKKKPRGIYFTAAYLWQSLKVCQRCRGKAAKSYDLFRKIELKKLII
jgi:hypothetical protein